MRHGQRAAGNAAGVSTDRFIAPPHEYAHTLSNKDEYAADGPFLWDSASLVNIGRQVRGRHLHLVLDVLAKMAPQWSFYAW